MNVGGDDGVMCASFPCQWQCYREIIEYSYNSVINGTEENEMYLHYIEIIADNEQISPFIFIV